MTMSYLVRSCAEILPNVATGFGSNIFLGFGRNNNALEGFILRGSIERKKNGIVLVSI